MKKYARGTHALGECARSGIKMLRRDMVRDGHYPHMLVHPSWWEPRHPQETLPAFDDPEALRDPAPENVESPTSPVLTAAQAGSDVQLDWTEAVTKASLIFKYEVWRSTDGSSFSLLATVTVERDYDTAITNDPLTYLDETTDLVANDYWYYVLAYPYEGAPSRSNTEQVT